MVLDGRDLPDDERARRALVLALMRGRGESPGLGAEHYQSNKVVVVDDPTPDRDTVFDYYQLGDGSEVHAGMECSNAAPVAALWARLQADADHERGGARAVNRGTGQVVELVPPEHLWWDGDWGVRFAGLDGLDGALTAAAQEFALHDGGVVVHGHVVDHGNVFVLAEVSPSALTPALAARLAAIGRGRRTAELAGIDHSSATASGAETIPKVVAYELVGVQNDTLLCRAACYSSGQQHHSLPGSAAMTLAAFLAAQGQVPVRRSRGVRQARARVVLRHPSGVMPVQVDLRSSPGQRTTLATSFYTPVRLLLCGNAAI